MKRFFDNKVYLMVHGVVAVDYSYLCRTAEQKLSQKNVHFPALKALIITVHLNLHLRIFSAKPGMALVC